MAQTDTKTCRNICWILGIIVGVIAFFLLKGAMAFLVALLLGVVIAVCLGFLLCKIFCAKDDPAVAAPVAAPMSAPATKPAETEAAKVEEEAPAAEVEAAPVAETAPVAAPVAEAGPDDLKMLKGVGPKIEQKLHEAGVTTFAQIAAWGAEDIAKMDDMLSFRGRIERDGWVEQAKTLAAGGETEFAKRVADGDVY